MTIYLTLAACAGLTLASVADASAQIRTQVYGDRTAVQAMGFGRGPLSTFRIEGNDIHVEAVAGPCPGGRPTQTDLRGSSERRLLIAPCILD